MEVHTWATQTSGTTNTLYSVFFNDANTGTVVGNDGTILRTTDGGANWISQTSGTTKRLLSVYFKDSNTGTAVGDSTLIRTTDGGINWFPQSLPPGVGTNPVFESVQYVDANIGMIVGWTGNILRTTDGGASWSLQPDGYRSI